MPNKPPILLSNWHLSSLGGGITVALKIKMSYFILNPYILEEEPKLVNLRLEISEGIG